MKLSNIFKKENKTVAKVNIEKLEKNQLEKVVGGLELAIKETGTAQTQTTEKPRN